MVSAWRCHDVCLDGWVAHLVSGGSQLHLGGLPWSRGLDGGKLAIHHGREYQVMTNALVFDQ
jgi:hypothetical protein